MRQYGLRLLGAAGLALNLALGACTTLPRTPYTAADATSSRVLDIDGLRRYTDEPITKFSFEKDNSAANRSYLALSGGGADGAYGVGVLNGWSAAGTRPAFSVVSGSALADSLLRLPFLARNMTTR